MRITEVLKHGRENAPRADVLAAKLEGYEAVGIEVTDAYYKLGSDRVRFALEAQPETAE